MGTLGQGLQETIKRWQATRLGLVVREMPGWNAELDAAVAALPDSRHCPAPVLQKLMVPREDTPKKVLLVTEQDEPVAVVPLRFAYGRWQPLTHWLLPGAPFPVRTGETARVLRAVGLPMKLAWWRCTAAPPAGPGIAVEAEAHTRRVDLAEDYQAYWRRTKHMKNVRNARNRCHGFNLAFSVPGSAAWTLRQAGARWGTLSGVVEDQVSLTEWLESRGLYQTVTLWDGERLIAGISVIVDRRDVVGQVMHYDPAYHRFSAGVYLLDRMCDWAAQQHYQGFDLGGGYAYKQEWAPEGGRKYYTLGFRPFPERFVTYAREVRRQVNARAAALAWRTPAMP